MAKSASSDSRTTQAVGYRPGLVGPGMIVRTYTFLIGEVIVHGKGSSGFFDHRLCTTYKWAAVEAGAIPHCHKAVEALDVAPP